MCSKGRTTNSNGIKRKLSVVVILVDFNDNFCYVGGVLPPFLTCCHKHGRTTIETDTVVFGKDDLFPVCTIVCMYVCMYDCMYVYMYVCIYCLYVGCMQYLLTYLLK